MKYLLTLILLIIIVFNSYCQRKHSVSIELIPVAQLFTEASGAQVSYNMEHNRFIHSFTLGFVYANYHSGFELEDYTVNGQPIRKWSTEVDIETNRPYPFGVVNNIHFHNLDVLGIKQYKPNLSYRLNRYFTYELLYKVLDRKVNISGGVGTTIGLTNRDDTVVGFTGEIIDGITKQKEEFWININIRAKYLYLGWTGRFIADYPITERFKLGLSSGFHYIFDKEWRADQTMYYVGVFGQIRI